MPRIADVRARAERLARHTDDLSSLRVALDQFLRSVIGYDAAAISTIDPATGIHTSCFVTGLDYDAGRERLVFALEQGEDVNQFRDLVQRDAPAAGLWMSTGGDPGQSTRYRELLTGMGMGDDLRIALRAGGEFWGSVSAYRTADRDRFGPDEVATAATLAEPLARLLRLAVLRTAAQVPAALTDPPGVLVVAPDGSIEASTPSASRWLDAIDDRGRVPSAVSAVAAASASGREHQVRLPGRDGRWIVIHAAPFKEEGGPRDGSVAVVIEAARPTVLAEIIVASYGLTDREREVTELVAQGLANKQIAARLGISPFTVGDHLKGAFAKVGVQSRAELVAALHDEHYESRFNAVPPGPYGWYLDDAVGA